MTAAHSCALPCHFTGKERDNESGLDYFGARYYSSVIGRFSSPDWASKPEAVPYSSLDNPQSLNLYTYVLNNPLSKADPDGHAGCPPDCGDPTAPTLTASASPKSLVDRIVDVGKQIWDSPAFQGLMIATPGLGAETGAAGELEGTASTSTARVSDSALAGRANAIQAAQDIFGQTKSTTAAASVTDASGKSSVLVGSSRNALTPSQRATLAPGEQAVTGKGHAETTVINAAKAQGMTVNSVAASRPICASCAQAIKDAGARPVTPLKQP